MSALLHRDIMPRRLVDGADLQYDDVMPLLVDSVGAVGLPLSSSIPGNEASFRANNDAALQNAIDTVFNAGGGRIQLSGIYYTSHAVGFNRTADTNVSVTIEGLGPWPCGIHSNSSTEPAFRVHTTTGNIRNLYLKDLMFRGGRTGLSLHNCNYCRFDNLYFWGSDGFALQSYAGAFNEFNSPYFTESAARGDAVLFVNGADEINGASFGELCGGIVGYGGGLTVHGGISYGCWYRGKNGFNYLTNSVEDLSAIQTGKQAAFTCIGGDLLLDGVRIGLGQQFVKLHSAYTVGINGCQVISGASPATPPGDANGFEGMIKVTANPAARLALKISGSQFQWSGVDSGYFLSDTSAVHDAMIDAQLIRDAAATITALSTSAPALLNPGTENNLVSLRTFTR